MSTSWIPYAGAAAALLLGACQAGGGAQSLAPRSDQPPLGAPLRVTSDLVMQPGRYVRPPLAEGAVVVLEGLHGVTLDLRGVELRAAERLPEPDARRGAAILLRDSSEVRLLGGTVRGYHDGLVLERCRDVLVDGLSVEGAFAQRLRGTSAAPHPADELELDVERPEEWLERYGAAVALLDCSRVRLRGLRARDAQNGVVLARSDGCELLDSDLSYLSGWGVALWRSASCTVARSRFDACARGYVAGRYAEPAGSAGLACVGPPADNTFLWNSAVGCGVGARVLGLRAESKADDRRDLWLGNDLRRAFGASFELRDADGTRVVENLLGGGAGAGLAASGARGLAIDANRVERAAGAALALFGSQGCLVSRNAIIAADRGIDLRDGRAHWVLDNRFEENVQDLVLERCEELVIDANRFAGSSPTRHLEELVLLGRPGLEPREVWTLLRGRDGGAPSGRAWQVSVRPTPEDPNPELLALSSLAPELAGAHARPEARADGPPVLGRFGPWDPAGGTPRPAPLAPGGLLAEVEWEAVWFRWDPECDPRADLDAWRARRFVPVARARLTGWGDPWGGAERRAEVGLERFGLIAEATFTLEEGGGYLLQLGSDDGLRVMLDGRVVHEDWTWHPERRESVPLELAAGRHEIQLEYFQESAAAVLSLGLDRRPDS